MNKKIPESSFKIFLSDCNENSGCQCSSYKPTIDVLQRCPKHGHLYQYGGALYPNQQRYNKDSSSFRQQPQQIPDQFLISSGRSKRNVANPFPVKKIQELLPGLRPNNRITKVQPVQDESEKRIAEILKANFGEDPRENIEELLRPKPLGSAQKIEDEVAKVKSMDAPATSDFLLKIKPKLEEARSNFRTQIAKIVNKARLDAIRAKHLIQKRSTDKEPDFSEMFLDDGESFDGNYEPIWITDESVEQQIEDPINDSENSNAVGRSTNDRFRKHCERCGELAQKFPCPSCGAAPPERSEPQNFEINQGHPTRYVQGQTKQTPTEYLAQPRYDDVTVGSYHHHQPNYGQLQGILDKNSKSMHLQNRKVGDGHLVQPMDFQHASDAIRFIQELTERNNNQYNDDYYSNGNSYEVGASPQNYHAKRSFQIVPLAEKDDGSVFVKISPVRSSKLNNAPKVNGNSNHNNPEHDAENDEQYYNETTVASSYDGSHFSEEKPKANFQKFIRGGKNYEILALSANGSNEGSVGSEEDLEILKYVYALNQKADNKENSSADKVENKKMKKIVDGVET